MTNNENARPVFWPDETGPGDDNGGLLYGIYHYSDAGEILDAEWYATPEARDRELTAINQGEK